MGLIGEAPLPFCLSETERPRIYPATPDPWLLTRMRWVLVLVLAGGCGAGASGYDMRMVDTFGPASAEQVAALTLMMDHYGAKPGWALPAVEWFTGEALTCDGQDAAKVWRKGWVAPEGCVFGLTIRKLGLVQLANDSRVYSELSFAHEMCHFVLDDQDHAGPCSASGVSAGREALKAAGF